MKSTATSLKVFGIYLILIPGIGFMAMPGMILDMFNFSHGPELWIPRMLGLVVFILGVFDLYIGKHGIHQLYGVTVVTRYFAATFMIGLWLTGQAEIMILMFAAIDALGATWTWLTMKNSTH